MIAIISDLHGNAAALEAVLRRIDALGVPRIVCLGDVAGYYAGVNACCETLRARGIPSLMGNHDWYIAEGRPCPRSTSANKCLDYQRSILTCENVAWLASLKPAGEVEGLRIVHAGWDDPLDEYLQPSEAYFARLEGRYFASGHTHVAYTFRAGDKRYCNPGSVGQPRDGDWRAAFALWDGADFQLQRVEYDVAATQRAMREAGFSPHFYDNLLAGSRIGGQVDRQPCPTA